MFAAHTKGVRYIGLRSSWMKAIGLVRLVQDTMIAQAGVAALVNANPAILAQVNSITLPPRGTFRTKGAPGLTSLQQFCIDNAKALQVVLTNETNPKKGLLPFLNKNDRHDLLQTTSSRRASRPITSRRQKSLIELTDSWLPAAVKPSPCVAPNNPCKVAAPK